MNKLKISASKFPIMLTILTIGTTIHTRTLTFRFSVNKLTFASVQAIEITVEILTIGPVI